MEKFLPWASPLPIRKLKKTGSSPVSAVVEFSIYKGYTVFKI